LVAVPLHIKVKKFRYIHTRNRLQEQELTLLRNRLQEEEEYVCELIHGTTQGTWGVFVMKPFLQTTSVEVMFARQLANLFIAFKTTQTNAALHHPHTSSPHVLPQCLVLSYRHPPFPWTFTTLFFGVLTVTLTLTLTFTSSHNLEHGSEHVLQHRHRENRVYHQHRKHPFRCTRKIWETHHESHKTNPLVLWWILQIMLYIQREIHCTIVSSVGSHILN